jgi:hypothetical protein
MKTPYYPPHIRKNSFTCPYCHTKVPFSSNEIIRAGSYKYIYRQCSECKEIIIWREKINYQLHGRNTTLIYPSQVTTEMPNSNDFMPERAKELYEEAAKIYTHSYRAAAALLRLATEFLVDEVEYATGHNLKAKIKCIAEKEGFDSDVVKALDVLRLNGNSAVHQSALYIDEDEEKIPFMFELLNFLSQQLFENKAQLNDFYAKIPDSRKVKEPEEKEK